MNEARALAIKIINRAKLARIAILDLQRRAGVGNTTIHRWYKSKTGTYCQDTADKIFASLDEIDAANAEWESNMVEALNMVDEANDKWKKRMDA